MKAGRYEQAREPHNPVLATAPSNLTDLANKGKAYYYPRRHEDAVAYFHRALKLIPSMQVSGTTRQEHSVTPGGIKDQMIAVK